MNAAFKEYSASVLDKTKRPSVLAKLHDLAQSVANLPDKVRHKQEERGLLGCGAGLRLAVYLKSKNAKKYRHGMEYGSARWGTREDIAPFIDPEFENNVILTKTERLMMNNRPKTPRLPGTKMCWWSAAPVAVRPASGSSRICCRCTAPGEPFCGYGSQRGAPKLGKTESPEG